MLVRVLTLLAGLAMAGHLSANIAQDAPAPPAREIAITFDDLPLNGPPLDLARLQAMTARLLDVVARHRIPVVGFVNEAQLYVPGEVDARIGLLERWLNAGAELANHTFSHINFKGATSAAYQDDVVRGDTVTRRLMRQAARPVRYFRHPFLQMAETREAEDAFERFLAERGYRIAPVTVDSLDWLVLNAYNSARAGASGTALQRVLADYPKFVIDRMAYSDTAARELFGRPIRHILLLHANELNADTFESLATQMTSAGWRFITLEEALADEAYRYPDTYAATSHWLSLWAASKGIRFTPPAPPDSLR
jgi:peptidoglycan-N-acetylglucosamine deacetylase